MLHIHCSFSFRGPHVRLALLTELPKQQQKIILKSSLVYTNITVQEILEIGHSQFEILTDNLLLWF
jgi:hypothetical protein